MEKTYGEKMVRSGFNPSESEDVKKLKEAAAAFIDLIREVRDRASLKRDATDNGAADELVTISRWTAIACTDVETACMYAVKAATI